MDATAEPLGRRARGLLHARLFGLYVASGAPLALLTDSIPQLLTERGASLGDVSRIPGRANLLYALKFLWGPAVDRSPTRRRWVVAAQLVLAAAFAGIAGVSAGFGFEGIWLLVLVVGLAAATQDLAVDGWTIDRVPKGELGPANSVRVGAYRIGMALGGGLVLRVAGGWGWEAAFLGTAALYVGAALLATRLPDPPRERAPGPPLLPALGDLAVRPGFGAVVAFVLLFKVGDYALASMVRPFQQAAGLSKEAMGDLVWAGMAATIVGAGVGGLVTRRIGTFRALWTLGLLQAASNLVYAWAAGEGSRGAVTTAAVVEPFCGGLGTAPFLAYLMERCHPRHAATQFGFWTGVFSLGRWLTSEFAGEAAAAMGFASYFAWSAAVALPAYLLLPWLARYPGPPERAPA